MSRGRFSVCATTPPSLPRPRLRRPRRPSAAAIGEAGLLNSGGGGTRAGLLLLPRRRRTSRLPRVEVAGVRTAPLSRSLTLAPWIGKRLRASEPLPDLQKNPRHLYFRCRQESIPRISHDRAEISGRSPEVAYTSVPLASPPSFQAQRALATVGRVRTRKSPPSAGVV